MSWEEFVYHGILRYNQFVLGYFSILNAINTAILFLSFIGLYVHLKRVRYGSYYEMLTSSFVPPISILVPSYNEEKTIVQNIDSLLSLEYGEFEIVVVNDGSKDGTLQQMIKAFALKKVEMPYKRTISTKEVKGIYRSAHLSNLLVIDKINGGKADALNVGMNVARYPLFTAIDADSILEKNSLVRAVRPFIDDPRQVVATGGIVRIVNGSRVESGFIEEVGLSKNPLAMFQTVEYLRAFLTGRVGWSAVNGLLIVSGAFGVFKKDVVIDIGGYTSDTIGEDMELILKIHANMKEKKRSYKIVFVPDPVCWTQGPEDVKSLASQRRRWHRGLMDSLLAHRRMLLNPRYGRIGMVVLPYYWMFEMIGPFIELTGYFMVILAWILGILNVKFAVLFFLFSVIYGIFISIGSILLEEYTFPKYEKISEYLYLVLYSILENFGYRQLTTWWRVTSILGYRLKKNQWGTIQRKEI